MPQRAPRICGRCGSAVSGRCATCDADRRRVHDATRPNAAARGYDAEWRKLRAAFLARNPTCTHPGCSARATEVDHIRTVAEAPELRLSWSNLRPRCKPHHSQRTMRDTRATHGTSRNRAMGAMTDRGQPRATFPNSTLGREAG